MFESNNGLDVRSHVIKVSQGVNPNDILGFWVLQMLLNMDETLYPIEAIAALGLKP